MHYVDLLAGAEHYAGIFAFVLTVVSTLFMSKLGGREGRKAAIAEIEPPKVRQAVGVALADLATMKAVIASLGRIEQQFTKHYALIERLVESTEGKEEKALREHIRDDFRAEMREMAEQLRRQNIDSRPIVRVKSTPRPTEPSDDNPA